MHPHSKNTIPTYHLSIFKALSSFGFYIFEIEDFYKNYPFLREKHAFDFYSIMYIKSGNGSLEIEQDTYEIKDKTLFLISPNQKQLLLQKSEIKGFVVLFIQDFFVEEFELTRLLKVFISSMLISKNRISPAIELNENSSEIEMIISLMFAEYLKFDKVISNSILRSYLNSLLLKINQIKQQIYPSDFDYNNEIIVKFSQLLENNFIEHQEIKFYAKTLQISETNLNKLANSYFENGVKKLIQNRLMIEARKLLSHTNLTIAEISIKLGFSDNSYFNKVFIKNHKITPGQFRSFHQKHTTL